MIGLGLMRKWFLAPPLTGKWAHICSIIAVALPTLIRAGFQGVVSGIPLLAYVPFVLLSAIGLGWRHATAVALGSAVVGSLLFIEPRFIFLAGPTDIFAITAFLVGSAMIIKFAHALKGIVVDAPGSPAAQQRSGIVFSAEGGDVWASWQGHSCSVRLGDQEDVAEMMQDFLAQRELGKQLAR